MSRVVEEEDACISPIKPKPVRVKTSSWWASDARWADAAVHTSGIPKRLSLIWLNFQNRGQDAKPPPKYRKEIRRWIHLHPTWAIRVWNDSKASEFLRNGSNRELESAFLKADPPILAADMLRVAILEREGGAYVDVDAQCLKAIDPVIGPTVDQDAEETDDDEREIPDLVLLDSSRSWFRNNWFMACLPQHPFMTTYIREMLKRLSWDINAQRSHLGPLLCTGPMALAATFAQRNEWDSGSVVLRELSSKDPADRFMRHLADGSWTSGYGPLLHDAAILLGSLVLLLCIVLGGYFLMRRF
jgi:mannosyltransferase OCH1-like enzyme